MLKIFCTSDLHANETFSDNIVKVITREKPDVWLGCGDFVSNEYAKRLFKRINVKGFCVSGNLDWGLKFENDKVKMYENGIEEYKGYHFLCYSDMVMPDLGLIKGIDPKKLVFITHYPPYGVLDLIWSGRRVGSYEFRKFLEIGKPVLHAFGHIHEANGVEKFHETLTVNCALTGTGMGYMVTLPSMKIEEIDMGI